MITNIDSKKGVTIAQIYSEMQRLIHTIPNTTYLSKEDKEEVLNRATFDLWKNMDKGKVDKFEYVKFKDYLFISLKNRVFAKCNEKNTYVNSITAKAVDIQYYDFEDECDVQHQLEQEEEYIYKKEILNKAMSYLPLKYQHLMIGFMNGFERQDLCKIFNVDKYHYDSARRHLIYLAKLLADGKKIPKYYQERLKKIKIK